jgi:hypothetical protein
VDLRSNLQAAAHIQACIHLEEIMAFTKNLALAVALLLPTTVVQERMEGTWQAEFRSARVHLNLRMDRAQGYSNYGRTFPLDHLSNLQRSGRNVSFELRRPAGTFRFEGVGNDSRSAGTYEFIPDPAYRRALSELGLNQLDSRRMLTLAIHNVSVDDVRFMQRNVRGGFSTDQLVRMLDHGANPEFVRGIYAAGFTGLTAEQLTRTRDHGVDPEFIAEMRQQNIRLTLDEYVRARDHGVSAEYVREMRGLGFHNTFEQLVRARDHGVDAEFVRELSSAGLGELTLAHYVELRNHGVSGDFAFEMRELGYQRLTPAQLIRLRNHGVSASFARKANRAAGRRLDVDELVRQRSHGDN